MSDMGLGMNLPSGSELLDLMPCGVLVTDTRGTVLQVNRTFCVWLGVEPEAIVGRKKLQDFFSMGGRIFHQTHWLPSLQMQGSLAEVKFDLRRGDGRMLPMMLNAVRKRQGDDFVDIVTLTVAEERHNYERELVLARKRADELVERERGHQTVLQVAQTRLRQAMNIAAISLWDVDPRTLERRYEPEVAQLLGSPNRPVGADEFLAAIDLRDVEAEASAFAHALADAGTAHSWTCRVIGVDGAERVVISAGQAIFNADGSLMRFVGVLSDVTEATRLRAQAEDRALFAEQMIGIVSHDLRNPLSAILMGSTLIRAGDDLTPRKAKLAGTIASAAQTAQRLIEDLLDFTVTRVGGGMTVDRQPGDFHALVARTVTELALAFPGRNIVHVAVGAGAGRFDGHRIAQLLGNLVGNAMTYGDTASPVTVTSRLSRDGFGLSVHNFGPAIPESMMTRIFEPMVRGDVTTASVRNVGLGLYIVKAIAAAHDGRVSVTSTESDGTTFSLFIPTGSPSQPEATPI